MSFQTISISPNKPWQSFNISLSGVTFGLEFSFNTRTNTWVLQISDANENVIISGLPLLIERNILAQYRHLALPQGTLFVLDNTGQGLEAGLYSFGTTHTLYYEDPTS